MTSQTTIGKEVVVQPLAARREALGLAGMIGLIILIMSLRFGAVEKTTTRESLQSYQQKDTVLQNQAPILYRSLLSVVGDIVDLYSDTGTWPDVSSLREETLPPFAADFLPPALRGYHWTRHAENGWVDYFGINEDIDGSEKENLDPLENSFILRIIDLSSQTHPHPHLGLDNDPEMKFSQQVWMYPETRKYPGEDIMGKGWKWIISSSDPSSSKLAISEQPAQQ